MSSHDHVAHAAAPSMPQVSLRSQVDSDRWLNIFHDSKDAADRVETLAIFGAEPWRGSGEPAWLSRAISLWPTLGRLAHLELRNIDFRALEDGLRQFALLHSTCVEELVLDNTQFVDVADIFRLIGSFENLTALAIRRVGWGDFHDIEDGSDDSDGEYVGSDELDVSGINCDLPKLKKLQLCECSSESSISRVLYSMQSGLHLSSLDLSWSDGGIGSLNRLLEACGDSLTELSISNIFNTGMSFTAVFENSYTFGLTIFFCVSDFADNLSLVSNTKLEILYLNDIYLFPNEHLAPPLYQLIANLSSPNLHVILINLTFEDGANFETQIDDIDWKSVDTSLSLPMCRSVHDVNINIALDPQPTSDTIYVEDTRGGILNRIRNAIRERMPKLVQLGKVKFTGEHERG